MEREAGTGGSFLGSGNHEVGENHMEAPFKKLEEVNMDGRTMGQRQRQPLAGSGHISFWLNWTFYLRVRLGFCAINLNFLPFFV